MKRTATLVAGLLLVTGTVFASEWKMTGATVEGTFDLVNTQNGALNSNGGDLNLTFKTEKEFTVGTVGVEAKFNKSEEDNAVKLTYSKTEGDFTVATSAKILEAKDTNSSVTSVKEAGAISFKTAEGSDTYIKWNVMGSKTTSLTFYPYEVDGMNWDKDTFVSFDNSNNKGGFKLATKIGASDLAIKFSEKDGDSKTENKYSVKGELSTKVSTASITAAAGMSTSTGTTFAAAKVEMPVAKFTVIGEVNVENMDTYKDAKFGMFAKGSYKMPVMNGYTPTAYASFKSVSSPDLKATPTTDEAITKTTTELGLGLNKGSFTITPKAVLEAADKNAYDKEKSENGTTEKSATKLAVTVKYGF